MNRCEDEIIMSVGQRASYLQAPAIQNTCARSVYSVRNFCHVTPVVVVVVVVVVVGRWQWAVPVAQAVAVAVVEVVIFNSKKT